VNFSIVCKDKPGALPLRQANRPDHLAYLEGAGATLCLAGPLLDAEGQPEGSLLIVDVGDKAAAEAFAAADPYAKAVRASPRSPSPPFARCSASGPSRMANG
jgi:uncharacterized protein YciI